MKTTTIKWLIGIALLSIQTIMYSQNFINDTKEWAIMSTYSVKNEHLYSYWTTYYKFSGDSIINGFSYHKLYKSTDSSQVNWTLSYSPLWWERNDSVFQRGQGGCGGIYLNDTTTLVYDFNLEEGDTFKIDDWNMKVDSIRYIEWGGSNRKHWFFNQYGCYPYNCLTWIEGVGHFGNFNYPSYCINSLAESLLCFSENGSLVYQDSYYTSCYVYTAVPSITKSNELINLFPNPATNYFTLNIDNVQLLPITFQLYDMQGRLQLTGKTGNTQTEINVATLPRGLYVLKIITNQQIETKKIVLQ
jgi:hypothetical protein